MSLIYSYVVISIIQLSLSTDTTIASTRSAHSVGASTGCSSLLIRTNTLGNGRRQIHRVSGRATNFARCHCRARRTFIQWTVGIIIACVSRRHQWRCRASTIDTGVHTIGIGFACFSRRLSRRTTGSGNAHAGRTHSVAILTQSTRFLPRTDRGTHGGCYIYGSSRRTTHSGSAIDGLESTLAIRTIVRIVTGLVRPNKAIDADTLNARSLAIRISGTGLAIGKLPGLTHPFKAHSGLTHAVRAPTRRTDRLLRTYGSRNGR